MILQKNSRVYISFITQKVNAPPSVQHTGNLVQMKKAQQSISQEDDTQLVLEMTHELSLREKLISEIPQNAGVSTQSQSSFTITTDGRLYIWGYTRKANRKSSYFDDCEVDPISTPFTNVMACALGDSHALILQGIDTTYILLLKLFR